MTLTLSRLRALSLAILFSIVQYILFRSEVKGRGTVEQVMNTETLSTLYRADIQVVKVNDRYVVVGEDSGLAL